jgi:hypothetical protein
LFWEVLLALNLAFSPGEKEQLSSVLIFRESSGQSQRGYFKGPGLLHAQTAERGGAFSSARGGRAPHLQHQQNDRGETNAVVGPDGHRFAGE